MSLIDFRSEMQAVLQIKPDEICNLALDQLTLSIVLMMIQ
jgi:hypothetical protein